MDIDNVRSHDKFKNLLWISLFKLSNAELLSGSWRSHYELCWTLFCIKKTKDNWNLFFSIALRTLGVVALYSSTQLFNLFSQDELI
jgi:hypothetical protein